MVARNNPEKLRIDQLLVERGLAESREKAQRLLLAGEVYVGEARAPKAGTKVPRDADVRVATTERFVGRGGLKLEAALDHFSIPVEGRTCLDVGASTGGFTDCLLQRGAAKVFAYDVGHGQLHWRIRQDPRVVVGEGINVRHLQRRDLPGAVDLAVADVSFISLTLILPPVFALMEPLATMIVLIKPQFELDREAVERGGVVRDPALQESAVEKIRRFVADEMNLTWQGVIPSPILGAKGNREFLACLQRP
jgi:23S rRNA (cytidine1920-2'-O)/16S rRNA (cytidine1409-2'-O)-methyltransferase